MEISSEQRAEEYRREMRKYYRRARGSARDAQRFAENADRSRRRAVAESDQAAEWERGQAQFARKMYRLHQKMAVRYL